MQAKQARSEVVSHETDIRLYAAEKVIDKWGGGQYHYFAEIVDRESDWLPTAQNPRSSAFGYAQFLNSTWKSVGCVKTTDGYKQIDCAIDYIELRYGTPQKAVKFHNRHNWY